MSMAGRKPTADRSQVRFKGAVAEWTEVENMPFTGAPDLPDRSTVDISLTAVAEAGVIPAQAWPEATLRWYRTMSRMPHACLWEPGDWEFVFSTAEIHARFVEGWKGTAASELRQRERLMGAYLDSRRDLRIRYIEPRRAKATGTDDALPAEVTSLDKYRGL